MILLPGVFSQSVKKTTWGKYSIKYKDVLTDDYYRYYTGCAYMDVLLAKNYTFNAETGIYTLQASKTNTKPKYSEVYYSNQDSPLEVTSTTSNTIYRFEITSVESDNGHYAHCGLIRGRRTAEKTKGNLIEYVTALEGTYPDDGIKDGFWYVLLN